MPKPLLSPIIKEKGEKVQGIIIENKSNLYHVKDEEFKQVYSCYARGKLKKEDISPVVGDRVEFSITDENEKEAVIDKIYERSVYIRRPKISNLTQLVFVVSSKNPKPDLLMLDKQLAFAQYLGINAVIVLNKTDLDKKEQFKQIKEVYKKIGYKVIETDARNRLQIDKLQEALYGNINAFAGNSGVGKSTLINAIFSKKITEEGEISNRNKRGKNTTTATRLYEINKDTYIADTPGFSTFNINEIESKELFKYFVEFKSLAENCEFVGCTHIKEVNCGIKKAVQEGRVDSGRYERFCKIYNELKEREEKKW